MSQRGRHRASGRHRKKRTYQMPVIALGATGLVAAGMVVVVRPIQAEVIRPYIDSSAMAAVDSEEVKAQPVDPNSQVVTEKIEYDAPAKITESDEVAQGSEIITKKGSEGLAKVTYSVNVVDGKEVSRTELSRKIIKEAIAAEIIRGTGDPKDVAVALATVAKGVGNPEGNRAYAKVYIEQEYGWTGKQYTCLEKLWKRESNWRHTAKNRSSGAYGIPQSLPGRKMAKIASDWKTNPITQIKWGAGYIEDRYGTPCKAWDHSERKNWY